MTPAPRYGWTTCCWRRVVGVICFALTDYVIARVDETQFAGLRTKTDALYVTESHAGHRGIR